MKRYSPPTVKFSQSIGINDPVAMILLIKDGQINMSGLCFMALKFSTSLYQYQSANGANLLRRNNAVITPQFKVPGVICNNF